MLNEKNIAPVSLLSRHTTYIEYAVAESWQGVVLQLGDWARC